MGSLSEALADAPQPANAYLSKAEKHTWAAAGTQFDLIGLEFIEAGKFGSQWSISVVTRDDGELRRMSFKANPARDAQFQHLLAKLAESDDGALGPALLGWIGSATKGFWAIVPADANRGVPFGGIPDDDVPDQVADHDLPF